MVLIELPGSINSLCIFTRLLLENVRPYTGRHISPYSKFSANCFCYFRHPLITFHIQMIHHLKALLESFQNLEKE